MVKVREEHPEKADGSVDLERWVRRLHVPDTVNRGTLLRACGVARAADERVQSDPEISWGQGASCLRAGLEMAEILAELHVDQDGLVAAILYRAVREGKRHPAAHLRRHELKDQRTDGWRVKPPLQLLIRK